MMKWPNVGGFRSKRGRLAWMLTIAVRVSMTTFLAAAAPGPTGEGMFPLDQYSLSEPLVLRGEIYHVQGLDLDEDFVYVSSVDRHLHRALLHKFTRDGSLVATADLTDGPRYHPGGIALEDDSLWVPVAEYRSDSTARILQLDKKTLRAVSSFTVYDHIGAVTAGGGKVYGANWDAKRLYTWDRAGKILDIKPNAMRVAYQDLKFADGDLIAAGVLRDQPGGAIDWLDPVSLLPKRRLPVGRADSGSVWTREGMTLHGGKLYLLPDDGSRGAAKVHAFDLARLVATAVDCGTGSADSPCKPWLRVAEAR